MATENNRFRIRLLISLLPGLHLRELQRHLGMSFNSTRYHVDRLEASKEILRIEEGGYSRLYPVGTSDADRILFALIRRPTDMQILSCMARASRVSQSELCKLTGFAKSTISEHLSKLVGMGVLSARMIDENREEYELTDATRIRDLIGLQNSSLSRKATDRFIDLWDF